MYLEIAENVNNGRRRAMSKSFLMGNEAIGLGAVRAGVQVVSGYPGTPSTEVLETVAKHNPGDKSEK